MQKLTQRERRERTRQRLVEAGTEVFAGKGGYHAATVDQIAARARYSTGAIYTHFGGKEELFLAIVEEHLSNVGDPYRLTAPPDKAQDIGSILRAGADAWTTRLRDDPDYFRVFVALWSFAVGNPRLGDRLSEIFVDLRGSTAEFVGRAAAEAGVDRSAKFNERLALIMNALGNGLALESAANPNAVPVGLFGDLTELIANALVAHGETIESQKRLAGKT